jgi:hypothetical protein
MVDSLFSFQDAATNYGDLANELLTTVLDGCGSRWTLKTAHTSDDEVRRTALDPPGSAAGRQPTADLPQRSLWTDFGLVCIQEVRARWPLFGGTALPL